MLKNSSNRLSTFITGCPWGLVPFLYVAPCNNRPKAVIPSGYGISSGKIGTLSLSLLKLGGNSGSEKNSRVSECFACKRGNIFACVCFAFASGSVLEQESADILKKTRHKPRTKKLCMAPT